MFWQKGEKWIPVLPKNYRSIVLHTINTIENPKVTMDGKEIIDYSEQGSLTQTGIRKCKNFKIQNGKENVLGFHDHPNEMWITETYREIANFCEEQGWLKIENNSS